MESLQRKFPILKTKFIFSVGPVHKKLTNKGFTLYAYKVSEWKHFYNKYCPRKGVIFEKGSSPKA